MTLEVEPVVGPDGVTIDLNLVPQVVEFEGFINYGSPINTVNPALLGFITGGVTSLLSNTTITLTDNVINQPIFSTRKVTTSVSVWDGQTVVLGGLMREDVQKTEDRTPILGDIPIVGRLFRTNVDQHIKRNLVIFVTARLVNPGGQPVNPNDEAEETEDVIEPPILPEVPMYKKYRRAPEKNRWQWVLSGNIAHTARNIDCRRLAFDWRHDRRIVLGTQGRLSVNRADTGRRLPSAARAVHPFELPSFPHRVSPRFARCAEGCINKRRAHHRDYGRDFHRQNDFLRKSARDRAVSDIF